MKTIYMVMQEGLEGGTVEEIFETREVAEKYLEVMNREELYIEEKETQDEVYENVDSPDVLYQRLHLSVQQTYDNEKVLHDSLQLRSSVRTYNEVLNGKGNSEPTFDAYFTKNETKNFEVYLSASINLMNHEQESDEWFQKLHHEMKTWNVELAQHLFGKEKKLYYPIETEKIKNKVYKSIEAYLEQHPRLI